MAMPQHGIGMDGFADSYTFAHDKVDPALTQSTEGFAKESPIAHAAKFLSRTGGAEVRFEVAAEIGAVRHQVAVQQRQVALDPCAIGCKERPRILDGLPPFRPRFKCKVALKERRLHEQLRGRGRHHEAQGVGQGRIARGDGSFTFDQSAVLSRMRTRCALRI